MTDQYSVARRMAKALPRPVGWSSDGDHPMTHDYPLTERQFLYLLACGVIRTDDEVVRSDEQEWTIMNVSVR